MKLEKYEAIWLFRKQIIDLARTRGWTCTEMSQEMGEDAKRIRSHVNGLEREGWIRKFNLERHTNNDPAYIFRTIPKAEYTLDMYLDANVCREIPHAGRTVPIAPPVLPDLPKALLLMMGYATDRPDSGRHIKEKNISEPLRRIRHGVSGSTMGNS